MRHRYIQVLGGIAIILGAIIAIWPEGPTWLAVVLVAIGVVTIAVELSNMK